MPRIIVLYLLISLSLPGAAVAAQIGPCPGARPIAEVRSLSHGTQATVHGTVSVPTGAFTRGQSFAVQDETGGIYVYRQQGIGQDLKLGDDVCVTGRLTAYHGLLELSPDSTRQVVRLGPGRAPRPDVVTPEKIGEETEGRLVSIAGRVDRLTNKGFRIGEAAVYLDPDAGITLQGLAEGCGATVVGLSADYDGPQVWPRSQADVVPAACEQAGCTDLSVGQLQGHGPVSPFDGRLGLTCVRGCVTGVGAKGFFIQDPIPDGDPTTSDGLFVFRYSEWDNPRGLKAGDLVEIYDFGVQEYYGATEIVGVSFDNNSAYRVIGTCELPPAVPVPTLTDPATNPETVYEPYEGMRVTMTFDGSVVGPTTRYASRFPAGEPEIALVDRRSPLHGRRIFDDVPIGHGMVYLSGGLDRDLPDVKVGDRIAATDLSGVLAYQFERFVLMVDEDPSNIEVTQVMEPEAPNRPAPIAADEFAICTFNLENLFDPVDDRDGDLGDWAPADEADFRRRIEKRAVAIREDLQGCTVVGVQEVEGKDAVWDALVAAVGQGFRYDYYESVDARDITVGILYDPARVELRHSEQAQACSRLDYEVDYVSARGPRAGSNPCAAGTYPLFSRPPYVAELTIWDASHDRGMAVTVVVNHFKSKRGDEAINLSRRIAQARFVAGLLAGPNAVALGDFNAGLGSPPLAEFPDLVNFWEAHLAPNQRYSYVFNGRSETLDHFIMTRTLDRYFRSGGPVHINADYPERLVPDASSRRSSDHDPLFVRFSFRPTAIQEALLGTTAGALASWWHPQDR